MYCVRTVSGHSNHDLTLVVMKKGPIKKAVVKNNLFIMHSSIKENVKVHCINLSLYLSLHLQIKQKTRSKRNDGEKKGK